MTSASPILPLEGASVLVRTLNRDGFSIFREFTAAVEQKQVAQQEAEKARFLVERAEFYKKAAVIQV